MIWACGDGSNAIWLAKQGWSVTAVDFSHKALRLGRRSAEAAGADVEFIVADAATYEPQGSFDLITSFYIQLSPDERVAMLSKMRVALNAAGTLLFVSHDRSTPPSGWSKADIATLTSVEEILTELQGMEIERAEVVTEGDMSGNDTHEHNSHAHGANTTLVIARAAS